VRFASAIGLDGLRRRFSDPEGEIALVRRLFSENLRAYVWRYALGFLFMGLAAGSTALNAWLIRDVVNGIFLDRQLSLAWLIGGAVIAISVVKGFATYGQTIVLTRIGSSIIARIQRRMFDKILRLGIDFHSRHHSSQFIAQVSQNAVAARQVIDLLATSLGRDLLTVIGLVTVMVIQDPIMAALTLVVAPPAIYGVGRMTREVRKLADSEYRMARGIVQLAQEAVHGIRIIKAFNLEALMRERAAAAAARVQRRTNDLARIQASTSPLMETLGGVCIGLVIMYAGWQVLAAGKTPGEFMSFLTAFLLAYDPAKRLARLHITLTRSLAGVRRLYHLLDLPAEESDDPDAVALDAVSGQLRIEGLVFGYRRSHPVLNGVSLEAKSGEVVALVGPSGGGKTTILNLVLRFYDAWSGTIRLDGHDIGRLRLHDLRRQISLVSQDIFLFSGSVRDNIRLGRPEAEDAEVVEAARAANADGFIAELSDGYDTEIGENGLQLSGGQRQRIAIARAILKRAPVLLLDEATSALDTESERQVQNALDRLMSRQTTIVIAHRLSTIVRADRIYVIKDGQVVGAGTHASLIAESGVYADLFGTGEIETAKVG
jgi:ATP-binding cassette, subfamily B, bacterial MsbA